MDYKILIVDDEPDILAMLSTFFQARVIVSCLLKTVRRL